VPDDQVKEEHIVGTQYAWKRKGMHVNFSSEKLKERDHSQYLDTDKKADITVDLSQCSSTWGTQKHLTSIKTKHRNCLSLEPALIHALGNIRPRSEVLVC
jgi:hypothetical protein